MEFADEPDEADKPDRGMRNLADDVRALSLQDQTPVHALPLEKKAEKMSPASPLPVSTNYVQIILSENVVRSTFESVWSSTLLAEQKIYNSEYPSERMEALKLITESALNENAPTIHMRSRKGEKPFVFPEGWGRACQKKGFHTLFEEEGSGKIKEDVICNLSRVHKLCLRGLGMEGFMGMHNFHSMQTLKLFECYGVNDDAIREGLFQLRLKQLYIKKCALVSSLVILSRDPISKTLDELHIVFSKDKTPESFVHLQQLPCLRHVETNTPEIQGWLDLPAMWTFELLVVDMNKEQLFYVMTNLSKLKTSKDKLQELDLYGMNTLDWSKPCDVDKFLDFVNFAKNIGLQEPLYTEWSKHPARNMHGNGLDCLL